MSPAWTLLVVVALLAVGCGADERAAATPPERLTHAGLYDVGASFEDLPLTHAESSRDRHGFFAYGTCEPPPREGGCSVPLSIQNFPVVERHPSMFEIAPGRPASCRRTTVRGVPAAVFQTSGGALEVYAGETVVVIWGSADRARRAALALRPHGADEAATGEALPRPPASVPRSLRRCATDSVAGKLTELRRAARIPLYWVGRRFGGHPLARVEGDAYRGRFVYGDCARSPNYENEAGCWPPLELVAEPFGAVDPSRYAESITCRRTRVRGVPVAVLRSAGTVHVFTRETVVTMYGEDVTLMLRAARALRTLDGRARAGALPAPPRSLVARLEARCRPMSP